MTDAHFAANLANWDERVPHHIEAYHAHEFADDASRDSVGVDAELLGPHLPAGNVRGLRLIHLQCHIGLDTISWARRGAEATGIDFSGVAVDAARDLAERAGVGARFVRCRNEEAPAVLGERFEVVFTSLGVLTWLDRLDTWGAAIADLLEPGGVFYIREQHPALASIDYRRSDAELVVTEPYFPGDPTRDDEGIAYASDRPVENNVNYQWPHSLEEILMSLIDAGLRIESFREHRTIPWRGIPSLVPTPDGFALADGRDRLPLSFSLVARKA